jgi:acyl transferase domain-containing protein/NADPH:quinone reductase-like Zn-dependent oxidoreductase
MNDMPTPFADVSALKLALMAKQVRAQAVQALQADPIAIVGMACRLPGGADTPDRFWRLMRDSACVVREVPPGRWNGDAWYDPDLSTAGKTVTKSGCFLDRIDAFDADYFGIPPREAERMDPQQRLFLEVAIDALDDAGLSKRMLGRSRTGVFVASYHNDYAQLQYADPDAIDLRTLTGTLHSVLANRLSYFLDLRGPSISIDSACSSSLVAVHLACQSLRLGESNIAVAGGVSLMIVPELLVSLSKVGFMAPDGRCKTFDEGADGFGRGEGCSVVVLKRLSDAIADADRVLAVIRGSAVNQDGHSTLLTAPNGPAQEALIREAVACAQLSPGRIGFVETHGTGTALGDPIEVEAIAAAIGRPFPGSGRCLLGSVKANVGHLEAAAGATGLIKAVLALQHEAVPGQVNYHSLNPHIQLSGTRLDVPTALTPWPVGPVARCAAVSSFGVGGTNAHVVIEEAPRLPVMAVPEQSSAPPDGCWLLPLSAKSAIALREQVQTWADFLAETSASVVDLCHTASQRRTHHEFRLAVVGRSLAELGEQLRGHLTRAEPSGASTAGVGQSTSGVGFVFSGQGPQWHAMGRELFAEEPVFRAAMAECDSLLRPLSGWSLLEALSLPADQSLLDRTEYAQPALFAIQVALAAQWRSWGVSPDAVVGHSVGEIAAFHVAGVLSLEEAVRTVWHRGRIMNQATGLGRMASVGLSEAEAQTLVSHFGERLSVAAVNGPSSVVLSGEPDALDSALAMLAARGISHRQLPVQYAFHSAQMTPLQPLLLDALAGLRGRPPQMPVYSTVTGERADDALFEVGYFARNMREPVRFAQAVGAMREGGCGVFIELSPHPVLGHAIVECLAPRGCEPVVLASLRRGRAERETMLEACAGVYAAGRDLCWEKIQPRSGRIVDLPSYPWQRRRHWIPVRQGQALHTVRIDHPLLGRRTEVAGVETSVYQADSATAPGWLSDHRIGDRVLVPAAGEMEAFCAAGSRFLGTPVELVGFTIHRPLSIQNESPVRWQVVVKRIDSERAELEWHASEGDAASVAGSWRSIGTAIAQAVNSVNLRPADPAAVEIVPIDSAYREFSELGARFGPSFRCLRQIERADGFARGSIELSDVDPDAYLMHPALIDGALQLCLLAVGGNTDSVVPKSLYLPLGADRIIIDPGLHRNLLARAHVRKAADAATFVADIWVDTPAGESAMVIEGMRFALAESVSRARARDSENLYRVSWTPIPGVLGNDARATGTWLIFADKGGVGTGLAERLRKCGGRALLVAVGSRYSRISADEFIVDPAASEDIGAVLLDGGWSDANPLRGVIDCWPLDIAKGAGDLSDGGRQAGLLATGTALRLVQAIAAKSALVAGSLILVTRGAAAVTQAGVSGDLCPRAAGLWGLAEVIAIEHPDLEVRIVDLDSQASLEEDPIALFSESVHGSDARVVLRDGRRWAPRLQAYSDNGAASDYEPAGIVLTQPGTFDGVDLRPRARERLREGEVRLKVLAAGLNFRDVLLALGLYPGSGGEVGGECAGIVIEAGTNAGAVAVGDRVFGYVPGGLATEVVAPGRMLVPVPPEMSAETAASLPIAFLTALYGLRHIAQLEKGQSILIHAAAGGVGLAAVCLARRQGAEVFATAGSEEKRQLLKRQGVRHVMNSRSLDFADQILALTRNRGVDVVLNSLSGEFIPAGLRALVDGGFFLELGKRDIWSPEAVASHRPDVRYAPYDLGEELSKNPNLFSRLMKELIVAWSEIEFPFLPVTLFPLERVRDAMRFMAQARHVGKIVLTTKSGRADTAPGLVRDGTYWITGGLGALGKETARWLARRGAAHVVLTSRHADEVGAADFIRELSQANVTCRILRADAGDRGRMSEILGEIRRSMPPLRGVIHAAGVIRDSALINQRSADADEVRHGKVEGAWILHELTRDIPLDFFVLYSAAGTVLGAPGQGMYAAANAELDALAHFRHSIGLPATSVAWGPWRGAGMAAELVNRGRDVFTARGLQMIDSDMAFSRLERLLIDGSPYGAVIAVDWPKFLSALPDGADSSYFSLLISAPKPHAAVVAKKSSLERLKGVPAGHRREALMTELAANACHVIGLDAGTMIAATTPLREMGLDSLMAIELRNVLVRLGGRSLPATLLFDYPYLAALTSHLYSAWGLDFDAVSVQAAAGSSALDDVDLAGLSDAEAETLLLAELANGDPRRKH